MEYEDLSEEMKEAYDAIDGMSGISTCSNLEDALYNAKDLEEFKSLLEAKMIELRDEAVYAFERMFPDSELPSGEEPEPLRIAIDLEGGLIPAVYSKIPLEAIVLDTDCEGIEEDEIIVLYEQEIYPSTRTADIKPKIIDDAFRLFEEGEEKSK